MHNYEECRSNDGIATKQYTNKIVARICEMHFYTYTIYQFNLLSNGTYSLSVRFWRKGLRPNQVVIDNNIPLHMHDLNT